MSAQPLLCHACHRRPASPAAVRSAPCERTSETDRRGGGSRFQPCCAWQWETRAAPQRRRAIAGSAARSPRRSALQAGAAGSRAARPGGLRETGPCRAVPCLRARQRQEPGGWGGGGWQSLLRIWRSGAALPEKPERLRGGRSPPRRWPAAPGCGRAGRSRRAGGNLGGQAGEAASAPLTFARPPSFKLLGELKEVTG